MRIYQFNFTAFLIEISFPYDEINQFTLFFTFLIQSTSFYQFYINKDGLINFVILIQFYLYSSIANQAQNIFDFIFDPKIYLKFIPQQAQFSHNIKTYLHYSNSVSDFIQKQSKLFLNYTYFIINQSHVKYISITKANIFKNPSNKHIMLVIKEKILELFMKLWKYIDCLINKENILKENKLLRC
ncbi:hypothetical protein TTHERM_00735350 (macronuclear) [Tetrahymena thermophila SB210]|uniref:Uncharacterized protein n=1 Tax=Tetrahymena thermophila (strain SB210) TaxID=312017 RepID=Q231W1_TETTS|nr:hypothetical protein TTHERM_00735350 [Tetrahymena thermophila SB210]EAR91339.1 hypothetical protein TTHERM_00735350 [Tetrahymena thermophila SB210]|eukprot:XP_001011584.1 hypothetical protein TTHERM_00735350 [Tetrahymena thermophila SB210]